MRSHKKTSQSTANGSTAKARKKKRTSPATLKRARNIARAGARYYRERGRDFPWRNERNAYRLAIAEILLQKTRAASVVETYRSLVRDFPDASVLAKADVDELALRLRPLGLSVKRARQLKEMGEAVVRFGNHIFDDWELLLADVPGLGAYAARAIASFGRGERIGIVDANIARILRRVFAIKTDDPRAVTFQRHADEIASSADDVRATNYGLLDVGAAICLRTPRCDICPFVSFCRYAASKRVRRGPRSSRDGSV